jgi:hypothetical protein
MHITTILTVNHGSIHRVQLVAWTVNWHEGSAREASEGRELGEVLTKGSFSEDLTAFLPSSLLHRGSVPGQDLPLHHRQSSPLHAPFSTPKQHYK